MNSMFQIKWKSGKAALFFYLSLLIVTFYSIVNEAKAQSIDSIKIKLQEHYNDTSFLKKSYTNLLEQSIIGTKKADSLEGIIRNLCLKLNYSKGIALSYRYHGIRIFNEGDYRGSINFLLKSLKIFEELKDSSCIIISNQSLASSYFNMGMQDSAILLCNKVIKSYKFRNDSKKLAASYNTLGGIYWAKGDFSGAADAFYKSLDYKVKLNDSLGIANTYNNIGILFDSQQKLSEALEMYNKSLEIYKKKGSKRGIGRAYNNIAIVLKNLNKFGEAVEMLLKSLEIDKQLGNIDDQGKTLNNIGQLYLQMNDCQSAIKQFTNARIIFNKNNNQNGETASLLNLGYAYFKIGQNTKALVYFNQSLLKAQEIKSVEFTKESYENLYKLYKRTGNPSKALLYHELFSNLNDSLRSIDNLNKLDELKVKYESERKETENIILSKDNHIKNIEIAKQKSVNIFLILLSCLFFILICLIGFGLFTIRRDNQNLLLKNTEISQQKEEIEAQRDQLELLNSKLNNQNEEIITQRDQIELKNSIISASSRRLTENIEYASRIQTALLPEIGVLQNYFTDQFILYKPKDIVSGDFYWVWPQENKIFFAIVDCTGHGVSGAFMSILAYNYLKDSVITKGLTSPREIIASIKDEVENNLYSNMSRHDVKDGLDIILCCFDKKELILDYSGAHSSFIHINNSIINTYKTDRYSIGSRISQNINFTNFKINLSKGDILIFYTDGYIDQLDTTRKRKIGNNLFKGLIGKNQNLPAAEQREKLEKFFDEWKGDYEQIDDVLIWGLKV